MRDFFVPEISPGVGHLFGRVAQSTLRRVMSNVTIAGNIYAVRKDVNRMRPRATGARRSGARSTPPSRPTPASAPRAARDAGSRDGVAPHVEYEIGRELARVSEAASRIYLEHLRRRPGESDSGWLDRIGRALRHPPGVRVSAGFWARLH